jgi:phosphonopyruvate decarboxylase
MDVTAFLQEISRLGVSFYTGVPDSLLQPLCDTLYARFGVSGNHIVAANEGAAVGLAAGHYIATGKPALVYLQNSGIGNAANPVISLLNEKVYGIPCVFVVGWRGEPNVHDEPQHVFQGEITPAMLSLIGLAPFILSADTTIPAFTDMVSNAEESLRLGKSVAFLVRKGALSGGEKAAFHNRSKLLREDALRLILHHASDDDVFVCTTGKTSREVYEIREADHQSHDRDFLTVGSMGHASMIALGIAKAKPHTTVWCLDGDGAALMHLGSLLVEAGCACKNLIHVVLNNGAHESVGGMPVSGGDVTFTPIAHTAGFQSCFYAKDEKELLALLPVLRDTAGKQPCFVEIALKQGSRPDLGRPKSTPKENLQQLMDFLKARGEEA